jgi:hypothetical protein
MTSLDELRSRLLTTDRLIAEGRSPQQIGRSTTAGDLIRLRPGVYVDGECRTLMRGDKHLLAVLAADLVLDGPVFSHWSAAALHGLPTWGLPLQRIALTVPGEARRSRGTARALHHQAPLDPEQIVSVGGMRCTRPDRTISDIARSCGFEAAVCVGDAGIFQGVATGEELVAATDRCARWRGVPRARKVLEAIDGRSESVAESRSRLIFARFGLPEPTPQAEIVDAAGFTIARVDFLWPDHGVIGECDGFGKYFDVDAAEGRRRLAREKDREAALLSLGYRIVRWRWADLERPWELAQRVRQVLYPVAA